MVNVDQKLMAVITTAFPKKSDAYRHRRPHYFWRKMDEFARDRNLRVIFVAPSAIDERHRTMFGWMNTGTTDAATWKQVTTRFPDVAYENVFVHLAGTPPVIKARSLMVHHGIPLFNPGIGNKWAIESHLRKHSSMHRYLPPTTLAKSADGIMQALHTHGTIYLKPLGGSGGSGIVSLQEHGDRVEIRSERFGRKGRLSTSKNVPETRQFVRRLLSHRKYLSQKGLKLTTIDHRKVDYRITVYRNEHGQWVAAGVTPKLGRPRSIVTNSHAGGTKTTMDAIIQWHKDHGKRPPSEESLIEAALAAAKTLQRRSPRMGLLGIDAAIDEDHHIWLLDFNPKPGRDLLNREMLKRAADSLTGYGSFLVRKSQVRRRS